MKTLAEWKALENSPYVLLELAKETDAFGAQEHPCPERVYRYRSSTESVRNILVNHCLYFSSPSAFNDAHEILPDIPRFASDDEARTFVTRLVSEAFGVAKQMGVTHPEQASGLWNWHPATILAFAARGIGQRFAVWAFMKQYKQGELPKTLQLQLQRMHAVMRLCCFTEDPVSGPMWANYGNQWQGFVIEFQLPSHMLKKVHYVAKKLPWPMGIDELEAVICTKHVDWSYEREWRIYLTGTQCNALQIDPSWITGIVFGHRCTISNLKAVLQMRRDGGLDHVRCLRLGVNGEGFGLCMAEFDPDDTSFVSHTFLDEYVIDKPITFDPKTGRV